MSAAMPAMWYGGTLHERRLVLAGAHELDGAEHVGHEVLLAKDGHLRFAAWCHSCAAARRRRRVS